MQALQLTKLNRATYAILLDVSPIVDPENNVLQHYMESDIVQLGLWGNVVEKNMRVKGTDFENLGFSFELPKSLMGIRGAVRVMRVEYDHYSKVRTLSSDAIRDISTISSSHRDVPPTPFLRSILTMSQHSWRRWRKESTTPRRRQRRRQKTGNRMASFKETELSC